MNWLRCLLGWHVPKYHWDMRIMDKMGFPWVPEVCLRCGRGYQPKPRRVRHERGG